MPLGLRADRLKIADQFLEIFFMPAFALVIDDLGAEKPQRLMQCICVKGVKRIPRLFLARTNMLDEMRSLFGRVIERNIGEIDKPEFGNVIALARDDLL